jgi:hypothetical protein
MYFEKYKKLTLEEIESELSKIQDLSDKAFSLPSINEYLEECDRIWDLKKSLLFQKYKLINIIFTGEHKEYGDLMSLKDFIDCCNDGLFIDEDGSGVYCNSTHESNINAIPSMISDGIIINDPKLTHVMWYNK